MIWKKFKNIKKNKKTKQKNNKIISIHKVLLKVASDEKSAFSKSSWTA